MIKLIEILVEIAVIANIVLEIIKGIKNRVDSAQTDNPKEDKKQ